MKLTKVKFTENMGIIPTDGIIKQCRNLIWNKVKEYREHDGLRYYYNFYTHSKKACKVCTFRFRCWTIK